MNETSAELITLKNGRQYKIVHTGQPYVVRPSDSYGGFKILSFQKELVGEFDTGLRFIDFSPDIDTVLNCLVGFERLPPLV